MAQDTRSREAFEQLTPCLKVDLTPISRGFFENDCTLVTATNHGPRWSHVYQAAGCASEINDNRFHHLHVLGFAHRVAEVESLDNAGWLLHDRPFTGRQPSRADGREKAIRYFSAFQFRSRQLFVAVDHRQTNIGQPRLDQILEPVEDLDHQVTVTELLNFRLR